MPPVLWHCWLGGWNDTDETAECRWLVDCSLAHLGVYSGCHHLHVRLCCCSRTQYCRMVWRFGTGLHWLSGIWPLQSNVVLPWLHCALSLAAQCIVIGPVCGGRAGGRAGGVCLWVCVCVCVCVTLPCYNQRAVFESLWVLFSFMNTISCTATSKRHLNSYFVGRLSCHNFNYRTDQRPLYCHSVTAIDAGVTLTSVIWCTVTCFWCSMTWRLIFLE